MSQSLPPPAEPVLGLRDYLAILRARRWSIFLVVLVSAAGALAFSIRQTPAYRSETKILVEPVDLFPGLDTTTPKINMETEQQLAQSPSVAVLAAAKLGTPLPPDDLLKHLSVKTARDTEILIIDYADPKAQRAQLAAQAFADAYLDFRKERAQGDLQAARDPLESRLNRLNQDLQRVNQQLRNTTNASEIDQLKAQADSLVGQIAVAQNRLNELIPEEELRIGEVVAPADLPGSPASPNHMVNVSLALFVGLAAGVGLAFLRERLDERFRGMSDLEAHIGAPVLAAIPKSATWRNPYQEILVSQRDPDSASVEAYRTLRAGLLFAASRTGAKVILVTSCHAGEGKTTTAANLAVAIAHTGKRVIVASADFRRPRLHRFFAVSDGAGLTGVLTGSVDLAGALSRSGIPNLAVLPSGRPPAHPDGLLGTEAMTYVLEELRSIADIVLIDATPVLGVSDAFTIAPLTDGVLFVTDAEKTTRRSVGRARQQLDQVNAVIIGAVLNNSNQSSEQAYPYYGPPQTTSGTRPGTRPRQNRAKATGRARERGKSGPTEDSSKDATEADRRQ
jgi:tyrosine-protein kinase